MKLDETKRELKRINGEYGKDIIVHQSDVPYVFDKSNKCGYKKEGIEYNEGKDKYDIWVPDESLLNGDVVSNKRPVLYLFHGLGYYSEWLQEDRGRLEWIMGYMLKHNLTHEMVIIMPQVFVDNKRAQDKKEDDFHFFNTKFRILADHVKKVYANIVSTRKEDTAIAGISIGGTTALYNGCLFKESFSVVAGISPSYHLIKDKARCVPNGWIEKDNFILDTKYAFLGNGTKEEKTCTHPRYYCNILRTKSVYCDFATLDDEDHDWTCFRKLFYVFMLEWHKSHNKTTV